MNANRVLPKKTWIMAAYARKITRSVLNLPLVAACPKPKSKLDVLAKRATKSVPHPQLNAV